MPQAGWVGRLLRRVELRFSPVSRCRCPIICRARVLHDRADVREVEVDGARDDGDKGSVTPWMPWRRVSSAMQERVEHARLLIDDFKQSVVQDDDDVSTFWESKSMPLIGLVATKATLEGKGFVTMPTVSAPISSRAISAMMGAAPVPMPPAFTGSDEDHIGLGE